MRKKKFCGIERISLHLFRCQASSKFAYSQSGREFSLCQRNDPIRFTSKIWAFLKFWNYSRREKKKKFVFHECGVKIRVELEVKIWFWSFLIFCQKKKKKFSLRKSFRLPFFFFFPTGLSAFHSKKFAQTVLCATLKHLWTFFFLNFMLFFNLKDLHSENINPRPRFSRSKKLLWFINCAWVQPCCANLFYLIILWNCRIFFCFFL